MERSVESFNARATRYDDSFFAEAFHKPVQEATLQVAANLVPEPQMILDVGCGTGTLLRMLAIRFPDALLVGVDPAERMVAVAIASLASLADKRRVRVVRAPAERLPFPDSAFDLVVSTNSFHHWANQPAGLRDISRVLEPRGGLVVADPFAVGWLRTWSRLTRKRHMRTQPEVEDLLRAARLQPLGWEPVFRFWQLPIVHAVTAHREDD